MAWPGAMVSGLLPPGPPPSGPLGPLVPGSVALAAASAWVAVGDERIIDWGISMIVLWGKFVGELAFVA